MTATCDLAAAEKILLVSIVLIASAVLTLPPCALGQPLPDGDFYGEQTFSPTVEILVNGGNAVLTGYNAYLLAVGRRQQVAGGAAVILGSVGIAIGRRDEANYPTADLAFGLVAVGTGVLQLLGVRLSSFPTNVRPLSLSVEPTLLNPPGTSRILGTGVRVRGRL